MNSFSNSLSPLLLLLLVFLAPLRLIAGTTGDNALDFRPDTGHSKSTVHSGTGEDFMPSEMTGENSGTGKDFMTGERTGLVTVESEHAISDVPPDAETEHWHGQLQFFSARPDSFMVVLGDSVIPATNGSIITFDRLFLSCTIIAKGYRDKQISFFPLRDSLRVIRFEMEEAGSGDMTESMYPLIHWRANVFLAAEPGTRFELDGKPIQEQTDTYGEFVNDHTVLLRLAPGRYHVRAFYPDGSAREEFVVARPSRLTHATMYQRPLRSDLRTARWFPGAGQLMKHQRGRALLIWGGMVTGTAGIIVSTISYDARRDRFNEAYQRYLDAPERSDLDALYREAQKEQNRTNLMAGLGVASALTLAGSYVFNVVDGSRGYRDYIGIDPYVNFDVYTGQPAVGFRYRFD